jgi:Zn-dependent protease with chaperone function
MKQATQTSPKNPLTALLLALVIALPAPPASAVSKVKLHGYITGRLDNQTVTILDDKLELTTASRITGQDATGEHALTRADLIPGMLIEAEGQWLDHHKFFAEKIVVDLKDSEKQIHGTAYLQEEPADGAKIAEGEAAGLKADGYWLELGPQTRREWDLVKARASASGLAASGNSASANQATLAGFHVTYAGVRRGDGRITAERVELGPPAPADAYKMPHDLEIVRGKDPQTGIGVVEFRQGKKVQGRMKLLAVPSVQEYISQLGDSLLPSGIRGTTRSLEFRFFVVEDPTINAASLPDGTLLINTGLLGAIDNEAQLAFILSHEIAHVLQVHHRREIDETRGKRIGLIIAGVAAGAFIGNAGLFMAEIGIASVVNGHQRELENQADRLGLQNVIEHGYDPREAPKFSRMIIERYSQRTTSRLWSDHDSSLMRGSFLTVQLMRQYPDSHWDKAKKDTEAFQAMKDAMGPVKIE